MLQFENYKQHWKLIDSQSLIDIEGDLVIHDKWTGKCERLFQIRCLESDGLKTKKTRSTKEWKCYSIQPELCIEYPKW